VDVDDVVVVCLVVVGRLDGGSGWPPASRVPAITTRPPQAVATTMRSTRQRVMGSRDGEAVTRTVGGTAAERARRTCIFRP
jgi:hypothetical protein